MKPYGLVAAGMFAGVAMTCIFFRLQAPPEKVSESTLSSIEIKTEPLPLPPPSTTEKTCEVCNCGPSHAVLPPPQFSAKLPDPLKTNHEAEVRVAWEPVTGAKAYNVLLEDSRGRVVKKYSTSRTVIYLKEVPTPADEQEITYNVYLTTVNADNIDGEKSNARTLKAVRLASVVAPTVKQIVIED